MSKESTRSGFPAGDFISEHAVRAMFGRGHPTSPSTPAHAGNAVPANLLEDTSGPAGGARRLRRWSVAELIARAVRPNPTTT